MKITYDNTNFYLNVTEWLASPGGTKFSKPIEEMSKEELNAFLKSFCMSADKYPSLFSRQMEAIGYIYPAYRSFSLSRNKKINRKPFSG